MSKFTDLIASTSGRRVWLADLEPWDSDAGSTTTLRVGSDNYTTGPTETPADAHYSGRMVAGLRFRRSLWGGGALAGRSIPGFGAIDLVNADGALDGWADYAWDGRTVTVRLGGPDFDYADFVVVFSGTAEGIEWGPDSLTVRLRDLQHLLDVPLLDTYFAGSGGWEGGSDLAGKPKPACFGQVRRITPVQIDRPGGRYMIHDGAIQAVDGVYDQGVALTFSADYSTNAALDAAAIPAGGYATCLAEGLIRLGAETQQAVTVDARGDASGAGYVSSAADIAERIAATAGLSAGDLDSATFSALNTATTAVVGYFSDAAVQVPEVLDAVLGSVGAWWGFDRSGFMQVGRLEPPSGTPAAAYTDFEILELERRDTAVPLWRVSLGYRRCWTVHGPGEIAAAATAADKEFLVAAWRRSAASDAAVQTAHPLAGEMERDTLLDASADAATEASRLLSLFGERDAFRVVVSTQPYALELGDVVTITFDRYGLGGGRDLRVVGLIEDAGRNEVELELWG